MYQSLSFDPESNGDTNAPNGIDPAFFQDQVRGNERCWGVLRGIQWNEGASRGFEGVGGKYIHTFYSRLYPRQDPHQDGSQHLIFGGGRIWMTEIDPQTGKLSIIAIN